MNGGCTMRKTEARCLSPILCTRRDIFFRLNWPDSVTIRERAAFPQTCGTHSRRAWANKPGHLCPALACHETQDNSRRHLSAHKKSPPSEDEGLSDNNTKRSSRTALCRPGSDLLSHALRHSTIGAEAFNDRVRNGIGFWALRHNHQVGKEQFRM